jgi:hypothetical protein
MTQNEMFAINQQVDELIESILTLSVLIMLAVFLHVEFWKTHLLS